MKRYYFAYGSNLLREQIQRRVGYTPIIGKFTLKGYTLDFNCGKPYYPAFANVVRTNKSTDIVEGILYETNKFQEKVLDYYEGFYNKAFIKENDCIIYFYIAESEFTLSNREKEIFKPSLMYLNTVIEGCKQNELLYTYNKLVDYKNEIFKNLKGNKYKKIKYASV